MMKRLEVTNNSNFHETLTPIRQGIKGRRPFWNDYAFRFIYVPSFNIKPVEGASVYRFTASVGDKIYTFDAKEPNSLLSPIWLELPIAQIKLKVEAVDSCGKVISLAGERVFEKAAPYDGPYRRNNYDYSKSAKKAMEEMFKLDILTSWLKTGKPAPEYHDRYRYASKMIGAVVFGAAFYSNMNPKPANADDILRIGKAAADFLITTHYPAGSPVENLTPTYYGMEKEAHMDVDNCMITEAVCAGLGYLELFKATGDKKYFEAAEKIANTYKKLQLDNGTWNLVVNIHTGKPVFDNYTNPQSIVNYLEIFVNEYSRNDLKPVVDKAVKWTLANPAKTFNWQNQFEDMVPEKDYKNLSQGEALRFAQWLLENGTENQNYIQMAKEILMYAEDQFVVWSNPPINANRQSPYVLFPAEYYSTDKWIMPCVCEQYLFWQPVNGSSADLVATLCKAYEVTGEEIYLAKAKDLADSIVYAQENYHDGQYLTYLTKVKRDYWLNCTVFTARAMYSFGEFLNKK
jgi:hypothetical protein